MTVDAGLEYESRNRFCEVVRVESVGSPCEGEEGDLNRGNGRAGGAARVEVGFLLEAAGAIDDDA